jgi:hypothetical protein
MVKPIELTEEHKTKLLEMCKQLFPELIAITIEPNGYINASDGEDTYSDLIHWFESTWILLNKIIEKKSPIDITEIIKTYGLICFNRFESQHPIDYLYEEFKKLK